MSLLSVTVKKARFVGEEAEHFNSYVTLKLQNVKSTTVTVKGANPCWEQDFLFETNDMNAGLLVEVWCKGFLWDRFLGYYYVPLSEVSYMNEVTTDPSSTKSTTTSSSRKQQLQHTSSITIPDTNSNTQQPPNITNTECPGQWVSLDSELEMRGADIMGTKKPTGHSLLIDCRLELPFDPENTEAADLQRKLEMLNNMMDQEARAEQARRQLLYNIGHSGYSEDSDYTSDLNYPVGGQGANSSASQFRTAANQLATPQRSLETSRENSYEREDHQLPTAVSGRLQPYGYGGYANSCHSPRYDDPYADEGLLPRYSQGQQPPESSEPLFYNSRPKHYKEYRRRKHTWDYEDSQDGWYSEGYEYRSAIVDQTRIYSDTEYYPGSDTNSSRRRDPHRRPSLERQMTLYDENSHCTDGYVSNGKAGKMNATYPECHTDIRYNEYYDSITGYVYQDERYDHNDADAQWDGRGRWYSGSSTYYENKRNRKILPQRPASSIGIHRPDYRPMVTRQRSYESDEVDHSRSRRRKLSQTQQHPTSRQQGTGKKLPPTPTKPSRQLPKTRTPSEESYYKSDYNEDYNYAYRSQDNLPEDSYLENIYNDQTQITGKSSYPEITQDMQYTTSYASEMENQSSVYGGSYDESQVQNTCDSSYLQNSYKDMYQLPEHAQENSHDYQIQYDTQYNITKTTDYEEMYPKSYPQVPFNAQENYQNQIYDKQHFEDYRTPFANEENTTATYKNGYEEQYPDYKNSYQHSLEQHTYNDNAEDNSEAAEYEMLDSQVSTSKVETKVNGYRSAESGYFYPDQDNQDTSSLSSFRQTLGKQDTNLLVQQNTDSLESRDDELKDSFDTGMSSISSSQPKKAFSEYSVADDSPATASVVDSHQSAIKIQPPTTTAAAALVSMENHLNDNSETTEDMTIAPAIRSNTTQVNGKRLARSESYQEEMEADEYSEIIPSEPQRKDSQLSQQSQLSQHSTHSHKSKLTRGDSYASNHYSEESYSRRGSYAQQGRKDSFSSSTKDSFKPALARTDSYQKRELTRTSTYGQNFTKPQPISRAESYQRGYFKDNETIDETETALSGAVNGDYKMGEETLERYERGEEALIRSSRENSLVEPYKGTPPMSHTGSPRESIAKQPSLEESVQMDTPPRSPPEPPPDDEILGMVGAASIPTQLKERPQMTARQRWHWAYNQIIMQLNVLEPLARALDILQSDTGMYVGYLLPILSTLQQKMENLNKTDLKAIQQGLNKM